MFMKQGALALVAAVGLAGGASAATLAGNTSGDFTGIHGANECHNGYKCQGQEAAIKEIGNVEYLIWPDQDKPSSWLAFANYEFSQDLATGHNEVLIGKLYWHNASSDSYYTPDDFTAKATMDLAFTQPSVQSGSEKLKFYIENSNNSQHPNGDTISIDLKNEPLDFGFDLSTYLGEGVTLLGFGASLFDAGETCKHGSCKVASTYDNGFWYNAEHNTSVLGVYAKVNLAPIPLPAGGVLLLTALGGLALARRRKA